MASTRRPVLHNVAGMPAPKERHSGTSNSVVDEIGVQNGGVSTTTIKRKDARAEARMTRAGRYRIG